jgi:hypothetical protein
MVARWPRATWLAACRRDKTELDAVLQELERAGKVKLTKVNGKLVVGLRDSR